MLVCKKQTNKPIPACHNHVREIATFDLSYPRSVPTIVRLYLALLLHMHINTNVSLLKSMSQTCHAILSHTQVSKLLYSASPCLPLSCLSLSPPDFHLSQPVRDLQLPVFLLLCPRSLLQPRPALGGADQAA